MILVVMDHCIDMMLFGLPLQETARSVIQTQIQFLNYFLMFVIIVRI